jgi:hypothetical protein
MREKGTGTLTCEGFSQRPMSLATFRFYLLDLFVVINNSIYKKIKKDKDEFGFAII